MAFRRSVPATELHTTVNQDNFLAVMRTVPAYHSGLCSEHSHEALRHSVRYEAQ